MFNILLYCDLSERSGRSSIGRASALGAEGCWFESSRRDQFVTNQALLEGGLSAGLLVEPLDLRRIDHLR